MIDIGTLGGLAGIAVLLGSAVVFFRGSYNKSVIEALRADNADFRLRNTDLLAENSNLKIENKSLFNERVLLTNMVTQKAEVGEVKNMLEEHHSESMEAWATIIKELVKTRG